METMGQPVDEPTTTAIGRVSRAALALASDVEPVEGGKVTIAGKVWTITSVDDTQVSLERTSNDG
jgi:hypothetical protein